MKRILYMFCILAMLCFAPLCFSTVYADQKSSNEPTTDATLNGIIKTGGEWFGNLKQDNNYDLGGIFSNILGRKGSGKLIDGVFQIGNLIFVCVTIILGIKYAFSSVSEKADVKESLIPLSIGAVFFYLAQSVYNFTSEMFDGFSKATSLNTITDKIYSSVRLIANVGAIIAIVIMGLKYMFTAADERAELKQRMVPLVIRNSFNIFYDSNPWIYCRCRRSCDKIVKYFKSVTKKSFFCNVF